MKKFITITLVFILFALPGYLFAQNKMIPTDGFILHGGVSMNSFKIKGSDKSLVPQGTEFKNTISPLVIAGYLTNLGGKSSGKIYFYPQMKIFPFKTSGNQDVYLTNGTLYQNVTTTSKAFIVSNVIGFGYNLVNSNNLNLFISAGPAFTVLFGNKQLRENKNASTGTISKTEEEGKGISYNLNGQLMALIKHTYVIFISTGTPTSTSSFTAYDSRLTTIQFGVGYKFKR